MHHWWLLLGLCTLSVSNKSQDALSAKPDFYAFLRRQSIAIASTTVHVLIPTKQPTELERTILSLTQNANTSFGQLVFHFGISFDDTATANSVEMTCRSTNSECVVHPVYNREGDISMIVNHMFVSINERAYFFRCNDDTVMTTPNWNQRAIETLRRRPSNVGLALIVDTHRRDDIHDNLQTHSFVSSVHRDIFGMYFPAHFKNWFEDDWITNVYAGALSKSSGIVIQHVSKTPRYNKQIVPRNVVELSAASGRERIAEFMKQLNL